MAWPPWTVMLAIAFAMFATCKWLTWQLAASVGVPAWRHAAYLFAWPGLNARRFFQSSAATGSPCAIREWLAATGRLVTGAVLTFGVTRTLPRHYEDLAAALGMIGLVMSFHFGALHLLSCTWRSAGVWADPVMNRPWAAKGLGDFWGRRWNIAFRDVTHQFVFRPIASRFGPPAGLLAGFLFSGLTHDLIVSVPARGGYGRPTLYFAIQGAAVMLERSRLGRTLGLGHDVRGRLFAAAVLLGPVALLFHRPFVTVVIVPLLQALGAIPR